MKNQTCCFTGHRIIPSNAYAAIQTRLEEELLNLIHQGMIYFSAGGALGFDTLTALTVLKLRQQFQYIHFILVLPCKEQAKGWEEKDKKIYNHILNEADKVVYTSSESYYRGCMHLRNRYLVDHSSVCLCYLTKSSGGTAYTVDYAKKKGLNIINLAKV